MNNIPQYVLKEKRLSKTKTVIIFRRNYLDISKFLRKNDTWVYEESFNHCGVRCEFKLIIHSENIFDMYNVNFKSIKIKGPCNCFGIFIRLPLQKLPIETHNMVGCAEYYICCSGDKLPYDSGKKKKSTKKIPPEKNATTPIEIPKSVSWSATHPFQGGSLTPK